MGRLAGRERQGGTLVTQAAMARRRETLRARGFRPAYFDFATCAIYPSRHADGTPARGHVLDGLPDEAVVVRADCGRVVAARATLLAGYERGGFFYTRAGAWRAARDWGCTA